MYSKPKCGKRNLWILPKQQVEQKVESFLFIVEGLYLKTMDFTTFSK